MSSQFYSNGPKLQSADLPQRGITICRHTVSLDLGYIPKHTVKKDRKTSTLVTCFFIHQPAIASIPYLHYNDADFATQCHDLPWDLPLNPFSKSSVALLATQWLSCPVIVLRSGDAAGSHRQPCGDFHPLKLSSTTSQPNMVKDSRVKQTASRGSKCLTKS